VAMKMHGRGQAADSYNAQRLVSIHRHGSVELILIFLFSLFFSCLAVRLLVAPPSQLEVPAWADMVKTGVARELAPIDPDWYYVRAAALARKVYLFPGRGVGSYSKVYGGAQDNGTKRSHHRVAATGVIRNALQSLEKLGLIQTADKCVSFLRVSLSIADVFFVALRSLVATT
jgi:ribosomal protein S19E (S16A)